MIFYKTRQSTWEKPKIELVEVEKASSESVWIKGRRSAKRSGHDNYFDSFQEAKDFLLDNARKELHRAAGVVDDMTKRLNQIHMLE